MDDHNLDYSATEIRALAWMFLQRRDLALHLRVWIVHRLDSNEDARAILQALLNYLLYLENA